VLEQLLQAGVNGILLGGVYGGFAVGLSLILGVLRIVNIAHSAVLIIGALGYWQLVNGLGLDPLLAIVPIVLLGYLLGLGVQRGVAHYLRRESDTTVLLAFFGLMVVIETIAIIVWTTDTKTLDLHYLGGVLDLGFLRVPVARVVAAGLSFALLVALHLFLTRTLTGSAIRGLSSNRDVAEMVGIDGNRLSRHVFAMSIAFSAFGGTALALVVPFTPQDHLRWLAWAFLVVILGGLGSALRTLVAGVVIGVVESVVGVLLPFQYTYLVLYGLLAVVLLVRNQGLGGLKARSL